MIYSIIGGESGVSETDKGGFNAVGQKPRTTPFPNRTYFGGTSNFFEIIKNYRDIQTSIKQNNIERGTGRFFLRTRKGAVRSTNPRHFIGTQNMGINTLLSYITDTWKFLNIKGDRPNQTVTPHCLRSNDSSSY